MYQQIRDKALPADRTLYVFALSETERETGRRDGGRLLLRGVNRVSA